MIYIILLLLSIILFLVIYYKINQKKIEQQIEKDYLQKNTEKLENQLKLEKKLIEDKLLLQIASYKSEISQLSYEKQKERERLEEVIKSGEQVVAQLEKRKEEQTKLLNEILADRKGFVEKEVEDFRTSEMQKARTAVETETEQHKIWAEANLAAYWDELAQRAEETELELAQARAELEDYRKKQKAINEAILRQRAIDERQDFYRVKLTDDAKQDIKYLLSIIDNIKNSTLLYKLIWSEYIQKPFGTMLKNITGGKEIKCVIYKITNINTQEIYIGKTKADVTKRWTEHIKTSLNIGTVARSKIHDALFRHWDEFTFEILEEVDDESKLSQREKYYINFYRSNIYGYNMNSGG